MSALPMISGGGGESGSKTVFACCMSGARDGSYYTTGFILNSNSDLITINVNNPYSYTNPYQFTMKKACKVKVYWGQSGSGTSANSGFIRLNGTDCANGQEYSLNVGDVFTTQTSRYTAGAVTGILVELV